MSLNVMIDIALCVLDVIMFIVSIASRRWTNAMMWLVLLNVHALTLKVDMRGWK